MPSGTGRALFDLDMTHELVDRADQAVENIKRYQTAVRDRIHIDAAICGGRPHIRGTRVRVCDILDLLANGVSQSEILADYPYLSEADLRAALAYGAAASQAGAAPACY